jgi:hypothetical protein
MARRLQHMPLAPMAGLIMRESGLRYVVWLCLLIVAVGLAGCAAGGAQSQGVKWHLENEAEKKRLNDAGFPQYSGPV